MRIHYGTNPSQWRSVRRRIRLTLTAYLLIMCSSVTIGVHKWTCPPCDSVPIACAHYRLCSDLSSDVVRWWAKQREMSTRRKINGFQDWVPVVDDEREAWWVHSFRAGTALAAQRVH